MFPEQSKLRFKLEHTIQFSHQARSSFSLEWTIRMKLLKPKMYNQPLDHMFLACLRASSHLQWPRYYSPASQPCSSFIHDSPDNTRLPLTWGQQHRLVLRWGQETHSAPGTLRSSHSTLVSTMSWSWHHHHHHHDHHHHHHCHLRRVPSAAHNHQPQVSLRVPHHSAAQLTSENRRILIDLEITRFQETLQ